MTDGTARTPRAASSLLPLWTLSLGWELRRGRQVVLHGEVNDRFWLEGTPVSLRELLVDYLLTTGAEIVGWWDPVDGLTFPVDGHEARFRQALSGHVRPAQAEAAGPAEVNEPADANEAAEANGPAEATGPAEANEPAEVNEPDRTAGATPALVIA